MYLDRKRFWGASQWVSYLWCCHQQPRHETVTPLQPSPFVKRWKIGLKILEETKNWKKGLVGRKVYVLCFVLWWKKRERDGIFGRGRGRALYWNKTHQNPHPTKQDPTRFHPKSCKFSKLILNYRASNAKIIIR